MDGLLPMLLERLPVVVLSPHLDDGVLSAFALLARASEPELVTVFTAPSPDGSASEWDADLGFHSSDEAMATRIVEDQMAGALLDVPIRHLGLREAAYRVGDDEAAVRESLRAAVAQMLDAHPDGLIIAVPAAMGRDPSMWRRVRRRLGDRWPLPGLRMRPGDGVHPDHRLVYEITLEVALPRGATVVLYEDLPYAYAGGGDHVRRLVARSDLVVSREALPVDLAEKEHAVKLYASQCPNLLPRWTDDFSAGFDPVEHYWVIMRPERSRSDPAGARPLSSR